MSIPKANFSAATFAIQIRALCGGKSEQVIVRMELVRGAAVVALKGNKTQWVQGATEVSKGKGLQERAFKAGFMAVGEISALFKPQDKIDPKVKAEAIEAEADRIAMVFEAAYVAELPVEKTVAEKEKAKADKVAAQNKEIADAVESEIKARKLVPEGTEATPAQVLAAALDLLKSGKAGESLQGEFLAALGVESIKAAAYAQGKAEALAAALTVAPAKTAPMPAPVPAKTAPSVAAH
jgi:hypothetical protein